MRQQYLACFGQGDFAGAAKKQVSTQSLFQASDLCADVGLGFSQLNSRLSKTAIAVGKRVLELEKQIATLEAKIEEIQKNDPAKVSYSEAARLVELGAGIEDLMNACGISRPEAELVRALTESKHIEIPTLTTAP